MPGNLIAQIKLEPDSLITLGRKAIAKKPSPGLIPTVHSAVNTSQVCNNSTFLLRLKAATGEKIDIAQLAVTGKNSYAIAANYLFSDGHKEGLLIDLDNLGNIINQKWIKINNKSIILKGLVVTSDGGIFMNGSFQDGSPESFIGRWDYSLNPQWTKTLPLAEAPTKMKLDIAEYDQLLFCAEVSNALHYAAFQKNGTVDWTGKVGVTGKINLVGYHPSMIGQSSILLNVNQNGRPGLQMIDINSETGQVIKSGFIGDGTEEFKALSSSGYNYRLQIQGWRNNNSSTQLPYRDGTANASYIEVRHTYTLPFGYDATITGAIDRAGDAMGYFLPGTQELYFLKHFAYYQIGPEFMRKYAVPNGGNLQTVSRGYDGGYLFGLNGSDSNEIILLKCDSIGNFPTCGMTSVNINYTEIFTPPMITAGYSTLVTVTGNSNVNVQETTAAIQTQFDCRELICPPPPIEDTCLSTYNKYYRSGSYADVMNNYFLMQNNKHVWTGARYERLFGAFNEVTYTLKQADEKGNILKTVSIFDERGSQQLNSIKLSENRILLLGNSSTPNDQAISIHLIDDDLNLLWRKSVKPSEGIYSAGMGFSDATMDIDGNIYLVATRPGFLNDSAALIIYKIDPNGNKLWEKCHKTKYGVFGTASITNSPVGIHIIIEVGGADNVSVRIDKNNGTLLNTSTFPLRWDSGMYTRHLFYNKGRLYFAGSNKESELALAKFDSLGRLLQIKHINQPIGSLVRNATFKADHLFIEAIPILNGLYRNVILKLDSNLDIKLFNSYTLERFGWVSGIGVSDQGNIYVGGNNFFGGVNGAYADAFIIKRDSAGNLGTCPFEIVPDLFTPITGSIGDLIFAPANFELRDSIASTFFVIDTIAQNISTLRCNSTPLCNQFNLNDLSNVCQLNTDYAIRYDRNAGCNLQPFIQADTSMILIKQVTDSTIIVQFKKNGVTRLKGLLNTGCSFYSDSIDISIQEVPISIYLGADTSLCPGDTLHLSAGPGYNSYLWQDGSSDSVFTVRNAGTYYVTISNSCGDIKKDTIVVSQSNVPPLSLGPDQSICYGDTLTLLANSGFASYEWNPSGIIIGNGSSVKVRADRDTSIYVHGITIAGCKAFDTLQLTLKYPASILLGSDTSFCNQDSITLQAGNGFQQYSWNTGASTESITIRTAGIYSVLALNTNGCYSRDTLQVLNVYTLPNANMGADRNICENSSIVLDPGNFASYIWQNNSTNRTFTISDTGWYSVQVTDLNGCKGADTIHIPKKDPAPIDFLKQIDTLCVYDKLELIPKQTYNSYAWSTGNTTGRISVTNGGWYSLSVMDSKGCKGTDSILIVEKQCLSGMFLPNAFTPNRDGLNDVFKAKAYGPLVFFELNIYNRYGQRVFSSKESGQGWDGTINGLPVDNGNFAWTCSYQFVGREKEFQRGFVLVIR